MDTHTTPEPTEPDLIRRDIEETREALADTVDALTAKLDVKARATGRVHEVRESATERVHEVRASATERVHEVRAAAIGSAQQARTRAQQTWDDRPQAVVAAAAAAVAAVLVVLVARRRS